MPETKTARGHVSDNVALTQDTGCVTFRPAPGRWAGEEPATVAAEACDGWDLGPDRFA